MGAYSSITKVDVVPKPLSLHRGQSHRVIVIAVVIAVVTAAFIITIATAVFIITVAAAVFVIVVTVVALSSMWSLSTSHPLLSWSPRVVGPHASAEVAEMRG